MRAIRVALVGVLLVLAALWLLADTLFPQPFGYFPFRAAFMQFSGVLGIGVMSVAMLLALRPKWLERPLGGLDKMYRLHKWLGIAGLVIAVIHWWWAQGTRWMVGWGWLERPLRRRHGGEVMGAVEGWMRGQHGVAEQVGEWAFYAAVVLLVLALVKRFPYHLFRKTHTWLAIAYLALVYHSVVLTRVGYWSQPVGWVMAALMLGGSVAALWVLLGGVGAGRTVKGVIDALTDYPELRVLETRIRLQPGWKGHAAGQFAFVTSSRREGAHPYTIASAWDPDDRHIVFITKALGDHTERLRHQLRVGQSVSVEGPYGRFDFDDGKARQIWVGAGIGITPFIARLKQLATIPGSKPIDLFHTTADFSAAAIGKLEADARAAGVRLHVLVDSRDGMLDAAAIREAIPEWASASIWFCGPPRFGQALRRDFMGHGLASAHFHQELFHMR